MLNTHFIPTLTLLLFALLVSLTFFVPYVAITLGKLCKLAVLYYCTLKIGKLLSFFFNTPLHKI